MIKRILHEKLFINRPFGYLMRSQYDPFFINIVYGLMNLRIIGWMSNWRGFMRILWEWEGIDANWRREERRDKKREMREHREFERNEKNPESI